MRERVIVRIHKNSISQYWVRSEAGGKERDKRRVKKRGGGAVGQEKRQKRTAFWGARGVGYPATTGEGGIRRSPISTREGHHSERALCEGMQRKNLIKWKGDISYEIQRKEHKKVPPE